MRLAELQARFHALVTAPESVAATLSARGDPPGERDLPALIVGDDRLSAVERLDIYAGMYFFRIRDVLRDELPRTSAVLGGERFHDLVTDYLVACPPSHPSLREVGARLPAFLADHPVGRGRPWLAELARLERARLELVDGPDADPLSVDDLRAIEPERLVALPLGLVPCHALLENRFAVSPLWRAGGETSEAASSPWAPSPGPETLLVWRRENEIRHRTIDAEEAAWLRRLTASATFEELCALAPATISEEEAAARAFERLGRFVADGLLRAPD